MKQLIALAAFLAVSICFAQTNEIDSLAIQLAYQKQDTSKVDTSLHLIKALLEVEDYKKALLYIDETERLSKSLDYKKGIAEANYYKALIYTQRDDYFNAIDNFNKSIRIYKELNDTLGIAKVSNSIGLIEIKRGNYSKGLLNSLSAIQIFEEKNLYEDLSIAYNNLAEAYYNTHQVDKALEFNFKALGVREQLRDSSGIKNSNRNIAMLYSKRKEHRKAIEFYEKVLGMINPNKDQSLRGDILPRIGEEYLQFKEYDKANAYLTEGLQYNRDIDNKSGTLRTLNSIGHLNLAQKNIKLAEFQINEAYALAQNSEDKNEVLRNFKLLVTLDSTKGNYQSAFSWQRQYYSLKHQIETQNQPKIPENAESISENFGDSNDSFTNETEDGIKEKQLQNLRLLSYGLIAAFVTALTILLLIYLKRKNTVKYTQELEEKNKQIQLQNDAILEQTHHLEEINKVKDRLFSIVSHDLKDSISSIKGFLDLLKDDSISKEEFNELIPELSENANNASLLLFNLLNWSKSQMQNLEPRPQLINIQDIFHDKLKLIEQKLEQKRIVLIDETQRDFVYADNSMIEIVIQNLLTNAVKFSRTGDIITISNKDYNGKSLLCIEDTGVGISKENIGKLFQNNNFTTIGTKNEKGTGLGLTICKELVELNKGRIWVESTLNVGSKFYVELPKAKPVE
uniref:tetratricopeptide repeat-containing sensor histidine kinase n=1 Tax=Gelidibacter sp. TaxID=2018083 RepID=UPI00404935A1